MRSAKTSKAMRIYSSALIGTELGRDLITLYNLYEDDFKRYAIIGDSGFYLRIWNELENFPYLHSEKILDSKLEMVTGRPITGIKIIERNDLGSLAQHYDSIIETAEELSVDGIAIRVASIPYLVADNCARNKLWKPVIELVRCGKINKDLSEEIRSILKATDLYDKHWPDFLQLLYDFSPNFLG